jgi:hypothetical protein
MKISVGAIIRSDKELLSIGVNTIPDSWISLRIDKRQDIHLVSITMQLNFPENDSMMKKGIKVITGYVVEGGPDDLEDNPEKIGGSLPIMFRDAYAHTRAMAFDKDRGSSLDILDSKQIKSVTRELISFYHANRNPS